MNHHLTRIASLPTTAGAGSALIPERNPSRPRFELTAEDMAAAGYPSAAVDLGAGGHRPFLPVRTVIVDWRPPVSAADDSMGFYVIEDGLLFRIGDAPSTPADRHGFEPFDYSERS